MRGQALFVRAFSVSKTSLKTLAFVEAANGSISSASLSAISAAKEIGKPVTAILAGSKSNKLASKIATIDGIEKVFVYDSSQYDHNLAEELVPLFHRAIERDGFTNFVAPASTVGKSFLPRLGAVLDVQPISEITRVIDDKTFVRPIYAGNALATVKTEDKYVLTSVRGTAFEAATEGQNSADVTNLTSDSSSARTEFISEELITSERPELGSASKVVAGGRGLKNKENFEKLLEPLAKKLNAAIGASRAAVDAGYCENSLQVGQTGKVVAPELYVAVGISGAIQHLAGMKDSKTIVAINKDADAPIFNVADYGLVADIDEALAELEAKL